ncbi:hypothetical protein [Microbacterium sp. NPDC079995]|uniref:hypothetical protein n=1 Tax=unclassified Microbacterium TaxID=2609290 RepID=UPI00344EC3E5
MSTSAEGAHQAGSPETRPGAQPQYTPDDRVAPEDHSLLWPDAHLLAAPPPGYQPLEMPAAWEPEAPPAPALDDPPHAGPPQTASPRQPVAPPSGATPAPPAAQPWPYAPYAPSRQQPPAPEPEPEPLPPAGPVPGYVISAPYEGSAAPSAPAPPAAPRRPATPRSFRDLRYGPLAGRDFGSMQEFAVAAVLEAGYAEEDVARLFRFAPWQLRAWVDEARSSSFGPGGGPG